MNHSDRLLRKALMAATDSIELGPSDPAGQRADGALTAYCEVGSQFFRIATTTGGLREAVLTAARRAGPVPKEMTARVTWLDDAVSDVMKITTFLNINIKEEQ